MLITDSALRFWSLGGKFFRIPTWTFQGQKNESPNKSYFHLRSPPRGGGEENSLSSFVIWVCIAAVLLVVKACSVREGPLDNSSEFLAWNWRIVCWHLVPAAGRASWERKITFVPSYPARGGPHSFLHGSAGWLLGLLSAEEMCSFISF